MITRDDWTAAIEEWTERERERLGGMPAPEEVVAFLRGELPQAEAERVRALMVYDPELTPLLDYGVTRAPRSYACVFATAATLACVLLGAQWIRLTQATQPPVVYASLHKLDVMQARGPTLPPVHELPANEGRHLLELQVPDESPDVSYRIEVVDPDVAKIVWTATGLRTPLIISLPHAFLDAGTYRIDIYDPNQKVTSHWIRAR